MGKSGSGPHWGQSPCGVMEISGTTDGDGHTTLQMQPWGQEMPPEEGWARRGLVDKPGKNRGWLGAVSRKGQGPLC